MGYDLIWFACKIASCDPAAVTDAITFEQHQASLEILKSSGIVIDGLPPNDLTPPEQTSEQLLQ